jgi:putative NADPH-quinone reductase
MAWPCLESVVTRILIVHGHPHEEGCTARFVRAYSEGAQASGAEVETLWLGRLSFDPILRRGFLAPQALESDLIRAQELLLWAEHLVFVFPVWWGGWPALLKGFVDRVFLPGFAFNYHQGGSMWDRLLKGRSARLIVTSDAPTFWDRLVNRHAAVHQMRQATLKFCGVNKVAVSHFGGVRSSSESRRSSWERQVLQLGRRFA